ncbi:MAG: hypothetical protein Q9186_006967 [Xanthomendoza sp. 1 TL-2023]
MAFGRASLAPRSSSTAASGSLLSRVPLWVLRFLQFVFAITVIALYAQDLHGAHNLHRYTDPSWRYAVALGTIAAISSLLLLWPTLSRMAWPWDLTMFILFTTLFGLFARLYLHLDAAGDRGNARMKRAVWIDLINMLLWFITAVWGMILFFFFRGSRSLHTGRATV